MNEKIEKLAEQCGIIGGDIYEDRVVDYEKFAELIVKECAQVCRDQPEIYALKADRDNCAIAIEQHFGVE